jgi:hypothetical protein
MLGSADERDVPVPKIGEMIGHGRAGRDVVAADELHVLDELVGAHRNRRQLRFDGRVKQPALAALSLRDDEAVHAVLANPAEDGLGLVLAAQLHAREHQARVLGGELLFDAGEQLHEPGVFAGIDGDADTATAAQAQIAGGGRARVAERGDNLGQTGAHGTADVMAVQVARDGAHRHTRLSGDVGDRRLFLQGPDSAISNGPVEMRFGRGELVMMTPPSGRSEVQGQRAKVSGGTA